MRKKSGSFPRAYLLLTLTLAIAFDSFAQEAARPDRGVMPNGSYSVSDIENINMFNGNVNIRIPLASLPPIAGGKLSWTLTAQYNSKIWDITREQNNDDPMSWQPYIVDYPGAGGGWSIGNAYVFFFRNSNDDLAREWYPGNSGLPQWDLNLINNYQWYKVVLRMPDGSEHEFRPLDNTSYSGSQDFLRGFFNVLPAGNSKRYYSVDGTYMFARISATNDWTVYMLDGTQIIQTPDGVQRIKDTNGNKIKIFSDANGTHYRDEQTNREIRLTYNPSGQGQYQVWYKTVTGIDHHIDINMGTTSVQGKLYTVNTPGCNPGLSEVLSSQLQIVREIVFPQTELGQPQRKFTFSYNSDTSSTETDFASFSCPGGGQNYTRAVSHGLGELSRIVMPSGATIDYSYVHDGVSSFEPFGIGDYVSQDEITEKKLTYDGGAFDRWTYDASDSFGIVTGPDNSISSESAYCSLPNTPGCATDKSGLTYRSTRPFTIIERHWTNLTFSGADILSPNGIVAFNPVVDKEYTTLTDAQGNNLKMSAKVYAFDYNGNVTQETHYDWFDPALVTRDAVGVPTGVPAGATVLKVITHSHYNQAATASSANVYAKRSIPSGTPLILNAPRETINGTGKVQFSYDGQAYDVAPTIGNLTTKKVWVDLDARWITTSNTYDLYGNVTSSTDGRGKVTQFFYDDATHALPNRVVVDPQNQTGTQTTTTVFDFSTGLVVSQTDANGQMSEISYTNQLLSTVDPFGRPGVTKSPAVNINGTNHKRLVTTTYLDSARQVIVATDQNAENDMLLKTRTTVDMLGRPVLTETTEDGTNYTISARNAYIYLLNLGHVTLTSSPMRNAAAATDSWTRVTKDKGGRVTEVATFGGAAQPGWTGTAGAFTGAVTTAYTANFTTVTDQAGKVRRSMVDALGRLVRVDEPDANGNLGFTPAPVQPTSYQYNVFDNLTTVTQGSQTRTFTYDSLSRLRSAVNPESGTISYQYDDNGNLLVKSDARGVSAHYDYDSLNRVTRRWYNGSNSTSAITHNTPALPTGVGATDEVKFYYDSQPLSGAPPGYNRGSAISRLVAQIYGTGSNGDYYSYDVLGQQTVKFQQMGNKNYKLTANYTLSGAVSSLTYPSSHTITNAYDQAGRLTAFSGDLGGAARTYSTGIVYSPLSSLLKEQFGTNTPIYQKLHYNSRAQICDVRASAVNDEWGGELGALVNYYSTPYAHCGNGPNNNGNLLMSQTINNSVYFEDRYTYDSLNRLTSVSEYQNGTTPTAAQQYDYDRWGNRTINASGTWIGNSNNPPDPLLNETQFDTGNLASTNRLYAPGDLALPDNQRRMRYDAAGNLTNDTYTGAGNRTYDAENKMTSAWGGNNQAQIYKYDGAGQRIKRTVNGVETWQVYGFGGELLAEYPANGEVLTPQKEYGYRNGQLLVMADSVPVQPPPPSAPNAGVFVSQSVPTTMLAGHQYAIAITFRNTGSNTWTTASWHNLGSQNPQDNFTWGVARAALPASTATGQEATFNFTVTAPTTPGSYNFQWRMVQDTVEWFGEYSPNLAITVDPAPANGANAAQCLWQNVPRTMIAGQSYPVSVKMKNTGSSTWTTGSWYNLGSQNPQDNFTWGVARAALPASTATGQEATFNFSVTAPTTPGNYNFQWRMVQDTVEWFGDDSTNISVTVIPASGGSPGQVHWLVADHLGTPRMVIDQTGSLANIKRHDYLPFGEELFEPVGGRDDALGYESGDGVRQQFTAKERDIETGLDYFGARYFASVQGRFTSSDPLLQSGRAALPQSWNRYAYVLNNPLRLIDPDGLADTDANEEEQKRQEQQKQQQQQTQVVDLRKDKVITAEVNKIQADAKPLAEGVTPVLSDVRVVVGETVSVNNGTVIDGYGNYTEGFTGVVRPVAYIPLNQNGNIIEGNGVAVQENVRVVSGDKPRTTDEPAPTPKGGVFIDVQLLASGRPTTTIQQAVFVGQFPRSGGAATSVFRTGVNEITKNADTRTVSVKLGPTQRVR